MIEGPNLLTTIHKFRARFNYIFLKMNLFKVQYLIYLVQ